MAARVVAARDNGLGARLGMNDFLIEKELARTAAGSVYRAKHGKTGKTVVLKARRNPEIGKDGSMEHEVSRRARRSSDRLTRGGGSDVILKNVGELASVAQPPEHHQMLWLVLEQPVRYASVCRSLLTHNGSLLMYIRSCLTYCGV